MKVIYKIERKSLFLAIILIVLLIDILIFPYPIDAQPSLNLSLSKVTEIERVGEHPAAIAVNDKTNTIYVAQYYGISVIDGLDNRVKNFIEIGYSIAEISVNPNTNKVYAVDEIVNRVYVIDGLTNKEIKYVEVEKYVGVEEGRGIHIDLNPDTNFVYIGRTNGTISVINGSDDEVVNTIHIGSNISDIALNPKTNTIYVVSYDSIYVIDGDTNDILTSIPIGKNLSTIAVNPKTNKIYVGGAQGANRLFVIDGNSNTFTTTFIAGDTSFGLAAIFNSHAVAVDSNTNTVYKTDTFGDSVSVIEGSTGMIDQISVGNSPIDVATNPKTKMVYVLNSLSESVSVIDRSVNIDQLNVSTTDIPAIKLANHPTSIAVNPATNKIYVFNTDSDTHSFDSAAIAVIDGSNNQIISNIPIGNASYNPFTKLIVNPNIDKIYASLNNSIFIIDGRTEKILNNIKTNDSAGYISFSPHTNMVYVYDSSIIRVIDGITNDVVSNLTIEESVYDLSPVTTKFTHIEEDIIYAINDTSLLEIEIPFATNIDVMPNITMSNIMTLPIKYPSAVDVNPATNMVYVTDSSNDTMYAIDLYAQRNVATISVGNEPEDLDQNPKTNMIYVANRVDDTVSIIDGLRNSLVDNIQVGKNPTDIAVNPTTNMIYIINSDSDTISVIDGSINKVIARVTFSINPANAGHIKCNDRGEYETNRYHQIAFETRCIAEANQGFQFNNWIENLGENSTRIVNASTIPGSPFNSLLSAFGLPPTDKSATLSIISYGNFTAHFKEVPPPIPPEYWIPLYGIIVSSLVGWSIPSIVGWAKSKKENRRLNWYHKKINSLYDDGKLDQNDIETLDRLKTDITDAYAKGKINDQHYQNLKSEISVLYEEVHRKRIDSLNGIADRDNVRLLYKIRNDIEDAYAKGKISDQHYNLLNKKIESSETTSDKKTNQDDVGTANKTHISKRSPI